MRIHTKAVALIAAGATALGMSACGATEGSDGSAAGLDSGAKEAVDTAYEGSFGTPPDESPDPAPDQNIWFITSSAQITDFSQDGYLVDAAEQMGWDLTLFDGQFNTDTMVSGLRQAVADQADGVIVFTIDCALVKAGFEDVVDAGIPIVAFESVDCDQSVAKDGTIEDTGDQGLFDAVVTYDDPVEDGKRLTYLEFLQAAYARNQALAMIEGTGGSASVIKIKQTDYQSTLATDRGFEDALAEHCSDCEVVETVEITGADFGPPLQDKVAQAIARHPEANAVYGIYDAVVLNAAPAVMASGRNDDIFVMGGEGSSALVELIAADRGVDAGSGYPVRWEAWASLDAMNRLLAGEVPNGAGFPSGIGVQAFDGDRNLPEKGGRFDGPVDFEAAYLAAWGLE
ncbi:sugar ABC transporter substrate-binding protein [Nocardioides speluncae]|uniref:sugar ABC transporter substrate-binding protein n=1 Tax=Nocardioides speluncae TaxID=2670337 RepID=UPI000D696877|nr:substrate-binding domain-containing protein [Nocardioides speluncae]